MTAPLRALLVLPLLLSACAGAPPPPAAEAPRVTTWGTMREVLRQGRSEGRAELAGLGGVAVGVGALEGLAGEVTIRDGEVLVSRPPDGGGGVRVEGPRPGERAALLVTAEVDAWEAYVLPACDDYAGLEAAIQEALAAAGIDPAEATPVRVRGRASAVSVHVIAGACPIARPEGPPPWRHQGAGEVELVGIAVRGAAGRLTHHDRSSHLHAVLDGGRTAGHLDGVALEGGAVLLLPARS
jgi:hypothetical protein